MKHLWPLLAIVGLVACGDSGNPSAPSLPQRDQQVTAQPPAPPVDPAPAAPTPEPAPAPPTPSPTPTSDNPPPPGAWGSNGFTYGNSPVHLCDDFRMGVSCLVVAFGTSSATIVVTNNNGDDAQLRDVFFTVYERNLPDTFETQTKYAAGSAQALGLKPHQSATLMVTFPACHVQLDVYVGPEINTPPHPAYKLLGAEHVGGPDFCNAPSTGGSPGPGTGSGPSTPAPAPGSGSPAGPPSPPGSPSPSPSVCEIAAPSLHLTSAATDTSVTVTATPTWSGAGTGTIAWGDTTSSAASNGAPISHTYTRQTTDTTFSAVLSVGTGSAMCSAASGISVPRAAATCPSGKAAVVGPAIVIEGSMARATFSIASGCSGIEVSLATYTAPAPTIAYPQSIFASDHPATASPQKFNAGGPYTLTAPMPACYWQVDLVLGQVLDTLAEGHLYGSRTIAFRNGGTVSCPAR